MLLTHLAEECAEVAQRVCKVNRFGLGDIEDGKTHTAKQRLEDEIYDVLGVLYRLNELDIVTIDFTDDRIFAKKKKIEIYLKYSEFLGTLQQG